MPASALGCDTKVETWGFCLFCQNVCLRGIVFYILLCPVGEGLVCCCLPKLLGSFH